MIQMESLSVSMGWHAQNFILDVPHVKNAFTVLSALLGMSYHIVSIIVMWCKLWRYLCHITGWQ